MSASRAWVTLVLVSVLGCSGSPDDAGSGGSSGGGSGGSSGGGSGGAPDSGVQDSGRDSDVLKDAEPGDGDAPDAAAPSPGCAVAPVYPHGTTEGSVATGGGSRSFRVHVPPGYEPTRATPVVLMFHGGGGNARQFQERSAQMDPIADREGFITVYPQGTGALGTWNGGLCCGRAAQDNVDDVGFVAALLDHLEGALCVDRHRVFATGMSNGALMSHRLACELSQRIAAIAPVAGTLGVEPCTPERPVALMQIHGTEDGHVPWEGGVGCGPSGADFTSVPSTLEGWRQRNGCASTTSELFTQGNGRCVGFDGCAAPAVLCTLEGSGHSWPGGDPAANIANCPADGPQSDSFSASEVAWRFFADNPMR